MSIEVDHAALGDAARGYTDAGTAIKDLHGGLSAALDQVASAAGHPHISAGTAALHSGMSTALRSLSEGSTHHAT
jgi:hypothetical protein